MRKGEHSKSKRAWNRKQIKKDQMKEKYKKGKGKIEERRKNKNKETKKTYIKGTNEE
jgi:hypothetical protein